MSEFYIQKKDWKRIIGFAKAREQECGDEIGGMAIAIKDKEDDWWIKNPVILKQTTTGGTCTLDKDELAEFYVDMASKYGTNIQFVWWHSHAKMGAFWSGTDTNTMEEYKSGDWSMFLVVNVREEYKFRIQYWNPIELGEDIDLNVVQKDKDVVIPKSILKEIEEKCSKETVIRNGYKQSRYLNGAQSSLFHGKSEKNDLLDAVGLILEGGSCWGYGTEGYTIQADPVDFLMLQLDIGNSNYCDGTIQYEHYKKILSEFNSTLRQLEGINSPKLRVQIYPKKELLDIIMTSNPIDFIELDGVPIQTVYEKERPEATALLGGY